MYDARGEGPQIKRHEGREGPRLGPCGREHHSLFAGRAGPQAEDTEDGLGRPGRPGELKVGGPPFARVAADGKVWIEFAQLLAQVSCLPRELASALAR